MSAFLPNRNTRKLLQLNDGEIFGDINASFNANLTQNKGVIRNNRSKNVYNDSDDGDFEIPMAIAQFDYNADLSTEYVLATEGGMFMGGVNPSDSFTQDTRTNTPTFGIRDRVDLEVFNDKLYASDQSSIYDLAKGGSAWTVTQTGLTTGQHILREYINRMYYTDVNGTTIRSFDTSEVFATSGANTFDISGFTNLKITCMEAGDESIWIGTINRAGSQATIFEWDGITANTPRSKYTIDTYGVLSCVIKDGVPYFMDVEGRMIAFSGSGFIEVAKLPVDEDKPFFDLSGHFSSTLADRDSYIRHNGMAVINSRINILIRGNYEDSGETQDIRMPSGVWEYDPDYGLYHKNSVSYSDTSDSGVSNLTDHGQFKLSNVGAISYAPSGNSDADRNGTYMFGANYFSDATTVKSGIFIDDSINTTQKYGYLIFNKVFSASIEDSFKKIYTIYKKLLNSADKISVKYRTEEDVPLEVTITWSDTDTFTTTTDISEYAEGDEVQVTQGTGGGKTAHISSISESGGTYTVNLDDTITGASGTAKIFLSHWISIGDIEFANEEKWRALTIPKQNTSPQIEIKIAMQFTGKDEIQRIKIISNNNINE